ncbi:glycosyltransferase family 2 protein [bacterium]|nr:glycosyltransferase family 2 protein [bacterium]
MTLSIIVPVYNEQSTVEDLLERVLASPLHPEIVVVDDGSSDHTLEILERYREHPNVCVVTHEENLGKGAAVRTGIDHVTGDIVLIQDADLEYDPDDYDAMVAPFSDPDVQVVYGSRRLLSSNPTGSWMFLMGGTSLTWITNTLYRTGITDEPTCYKAFRTELLRSLPLKCERFEFCPEVTALVARRGIRIHEVPIRYAPRGRRNGKKIGVGDWLEAVHTLLKYRFAPGRALGPRESQSQAER